MHGVPDVALLDTAGRYRRHVHVHAPAHASPATWHRLLSDVDRAGAPGRVTVEHDGRPLLEVRSLRALRRVALWDRPDLVDTQRFPLPRQTSYRPVPAWRVVC